MTPCIVVIAIIGILAAMVFPVFARARESARKAVCLSNVKNIALAIQMYLADNNDNFWTTEHREEVIAYFDVCPGGRDDPIGGIPCHVGTMHANPYLRVPVLLDEYVKNRDVWRCPSAKMTGGAMFINGDPDWFGYLVAHEGEWGQGDPDSICVKDGSYPQGWGGVVTDSVVQRRMANIYAGVGARENPQLKSFAQSYATNDTFYYTKFVEIQDATNYVAVGDAGSCTDFMNAAHIAWPDICNANCANCCCSDWREPGCYDEQMAGCPECASLHARGGDDPKTNFLMNPDVRKAYTRHLGGSNIGWADGHASWMLADAWLDKWADDAKASNSTLGCGVWSWGPVSWCSSTETGGLPFAQAFPGEPTIR